MIFNRSDKLFEDAARNAADFDKLLKRFRSIRSGLFITFSCALLMLFVFAGWFLTQVVQLLRSPSFEIPPSLQHVTSFGTNNLILAAIVLVSTFTSLLGAAMDADGRVKSLLLFRASREAASPQIPNERSA